MTSEQAIHSKIAAYQKDMWQFIEKIVNIDSGADAPEGIAAVAHFIGEVLEPLGFTVEYSQNPGPITNFVARRPAPGKPAVLIMGHMDTVFPKGTAAARPFRLENGIAYGPGVMDMKSGIGISVFTVKAMLETGFNGADITFLFAGDEEPNHPYSNAAELFTEHAKGKTAAFNMEPGREHGEIVYGRKGVWRPLIKVKGIPAHSGNDYEKGASAILELAKKTIDMFGITDLAAGTTCNVGVVQGGSVPNIMAENASARLDIRFKTVAELEKARARLTEICAHNYDERTRTEIIESGPSDCMPPFEKTDGGMKLCRFIQEQHKRLGYGELEAIYVGGSSDAAYTTIAGTPTVCSMGPQSVGAHTNNEYAYVASYEPRCHLLAACLLHIGEL